LQAQASRAQELEAELAKAKEAESTLRLEIEQRLAKEKEILAVKYATEVDELRASQDIELEKRDAKVQRLSDLCPIMTSTLPSLAFGARGIASTTPASKG
jgi:dihydrodipicolinate synthase/N-acetylneuraminate lyase